MRKLLLLFAALLLVPTAAHAQADFETFATASEIRDGGTLDTLRIDFLDRLPTGEFVFYNSPSGDLVGYDDALPAGSRTRIIRTAGDLEDDLGTDLTVDDLDAGTDGNVYLLARDASNNNQIYKTDAAGATESVLGTVNGADAIEVVGTTVYIGAIGAFGAPENGIYAISTTGTGQSGDVVIQDPDANPADILQSTSSGDLYFYSGSFGNPPFARALVKVEDPDGSPSLNPLYTPFATGTFTDTGAGIAGLAAANLDGADRVYLYNSSFDATDGEEFGVFQGDGSSDGFVFATESDVANDPDVGSSAIRNASSPLYIDPTTGDLFFASIFDADAPDDDSRNAIIRIFDQPLPVEFAGAPQATVDGRDVRLAWTTLSETGNAGFYVEHRRASAGQHAWTSANAALIEGAGTATSAHTYRYTAEDLSPGRYTFRVRQVDIDDGQSFSPTVSVEVSASEGFALRAPSQNPFQSRTTLRYSAPESAQVEAVLYNTLGQQVRSLNASNGRIEVEGGSLASGVYFVRLLTDDGRAEVQTVTLVR